MVSSDKCDGVCDSEWLLRSRQISRWLDVAPNSDLNIGSQVGILKGTFVGPWVLPRSTNNPGPRPRSRTDTHSKFTGLADGVKTHRKANTQAVLRYAPYSTLYKYIWMCSIVQYVCVSIHVLKIQYLEVIYTSRRRERSYNKHPEPSMTPAVAGSHSGVWFATTTGTTTGQTLSMGNWGLII